MKNKILIIDGQNMAYRAYYKFSNMRTSKSVLSGIIYGMPYILSSLIGQHNPDEVIVVFDGGRDKHRTKIHPDYKKRDKKVSFDKDNFQEQMDVMTNILLALGLKVVKVPKKEADDIIWILTKKLKRKNQIVIVSADKDFNQLVSPTVSIWNPKASKGKGMRYHHKNLKQETGYDADQCVDYLILDGDTSDNIKGMPGVGPVKALEFINNHSIEEYLTSNKPELKLFPRQKLEDVFLLNRQLIDIRRHCRKQLKGIEIVVKHSGKDKIATKKLNLYAADYEVSTFLKPTFLKPFEKLLNKNKNCNIWTKSLSQTILQKQKLP